MRHTVLGLSIVLFAGLALPAFGADPEKELEKAAKAGNSAGMVAALTEMRTAGVTKDHVEAILKYVPVSAPAVPDAAAFSAARDALAATTGPARDEVVKALVKGKRLEPRVLCADALGGVQDDAAAAALAEVLTDREMPLRVTAIRALARLARRACVERSDPEGVDLREAGPGAHAERVLAERAVGRDPEAAADPLAVAPPVLPHGLERPDLLEAGAVEDEGLGVVEPIALERELDLRPALPSAREELLEVRRRRERGRGREQEREREPSDHAPPQASSSFTTVPSFTSSTGRSPGARSSVSATIPSVWYTVVAQSSTVRAPESGSAAVASDSPWAWPRFTPPPAMTRLKTFGQWSRPPVLLSFGVRPNSLVTRTRVESRSFRSSRSVMSCAKARSKAGSRCLSFG